MTGDPVLLTDTCADLPAEIVEELGIEVVNFPYTLAGVEYLDDFGRAQPHAEFYAAMRAGNHPTTMQIPRAAFERAFRRHAEAGEPLLYLGFSSALSGTFDLAWAVRAEVLADHPEADIRLVDTRAASVAQGLLVYEAARMWREGRTLDEIEAWVSARRPHLNGWFTIDDLETLKRGGRLSGAAATAGALLDVKPILYVTADGRLEVRRNVRGRQKSMRALADTIAERSDTAEATTIVLGHGDSTDDLGRLREMVADRVNAARVIEMEVGPVIGAHTGPGMLALAFWGTPV